MNVIVFASRKGGSGKSTLAAHLSTFAHKPSRPVLLIDADPQGSLTLWQRYRPDGQPPLKSGARGIGDILKSARREGYEWVFVDTPPNMASNVIEAIRAATMVVIPARPTVFDLAAVRDTIAVARDLKTPYAVVLNATSPKREDIEAPVVTQAREALDRERIPIWSGQITNRVNYSLALASGEGAREFDADSAAAIEIGRLWSALEKSVAAINGANTSARVMHKAAA